MCVFNGYLNLVSACGCATLQLWWLEVAVREVCKHFVEVGSAESLNVVNMWKVNALYLSKRILTFVVKVCTHSEKLPV